MCVYLYICIYMYIIRCRAQGRGSGVSDTCFPRYGAVPLQLERASPEFGLRLALGAVARIALTQVFRSLSIYLSTYVCIHIYIYIYIYICINTYLYICIDR